MPYLALDIRTLLLISAATYAILAGSAFVVWRLNPAERYTHDWALASVCGATANLLLGLRHLVPDFLSIVMANALVLFSLSMMAVAIRRFLAAPLHPRWYWVPAALAVVPFLLTTYVWPSTLARIELFSAGEIIFCLIFIRWLVHPAAPGLRLSQHLMAAAFGLVAAGSLARATLSPWADTAPDLMQAGLVTGGYLVLHIMGVTGLAISWVVLVTQRLQLRLGESEAKYRSVIEQIPDIFYRTDRASRVILTSPSATALLGYTAIDEILGRHMETFWRQPQHRSEMLAQLRHGPVKDFETELVKKSGETVPVSVSCHYYTDEAGALAGVEGIIRDITERKGAQEALRAEHAQLAQHVEIRTAELSATNAELTRALASRDEFLAAMSHELRTPLTAILGQADMLRSELSGPLNERQLWQADTIYTSGQHLLQLINDVLDLARLMGGRLELDLSPVPLDELCQSCLRSSRREADKKHQTLRYIPAPEVPILYADGGRVKQMLMNLLSNAIKFTPEGGEAGLEVQSDAGRQVVHLTVWDHGIGIAADDLPRLFQNFVQLDSRLTRDYEGTGLGLALVKRLAEMHGGEVSVTSTPSQGSRFTLTLPWKPA